MKKLNDLDTTGVNDIISVGKKILKLFYSFMILALIIGAIFILERLNIFEIVLDILKVLSPVFIGFVIAWLFSPLIKKMESKKIPKLAAAGIIYLGIILFLFLFVRLFIPIIYDQINDFINILPGVLDTLNDILNRLVTAIGASGVDITTIEDSIITYLEDLSKGLAGAISSSAISIVSSVFSGIINFVFSLIIGFYMLVDFESIEKKLVSFVPVKYKKETMTVLSEIGQEVRKVVNGILLIASMVFLCDTIGFAIVGLDAALLLGLFCGITDLIPFVGPYIGGGLAVIVGYTQGPVVGTGVLIIALVVQLLENYVLQPVVMGKATNLHPVIIIVTLLLFGYFFGIVGMILATPILTILKVIINFINNKYKIFETSIE